MFPILCNGRYGVRKAISSCLLSHNLKNISIPNFKNNSLKYFPRKKEILYYVNARCSLSVTSKKNSDETVKQNPIDLKDWQPVEASLSKLPHIYSSLSKWYLTLFVAMTMDAGYCLAPVTFDYFTFFLVTAGTILCSASANTLNQIFEVPYDAQMDRTRQRPLVRGLITPAHAAAFALATGSSGTMLLYYGSNVLTASLGLVTIVLYAYVYTPLKRKHWSNTWFGAVVGAIPPLMGWTAATGYLDPGSFILSGILFAWQFPHFYALSWRRRGDYARGAYHMLPLTHPTATKHVVVAHSLALWALCSAAPATGVTSFYFALMALPLNIWLTNNSIRFQQNGDSRSAQSLYKSSLYYIMFVSLAFVLDRKVLSKLKKENIQVPFFHNTLAV